VPFGLPETVEAVYAVAPVIVEAGTLVAFVA
jgi:hypothetical protein